jgi:hypothetical protein
MICWLLVALMSSSCFDEMLIMLSRESGEQGAHIIRACMDSTD